MISAPAQFASPPFAHRVFADLTYGLPTDGSTSESAIHTIFYTILGLNAAMLLFITVLMLTFIVVYRRRSPNDHPKGPTKNIPLETFWIATPVLIFIGLFFFGFTEYIRIANPPANAYEVEAIARKWNWQFDYPNGATSHRLHVPINEPIVLDMMSPDVIHDFYCPALGVHHDIVPARSNLAWFRVTKPGVYTVFCTQYCGTGHSQMVTQVVAYKSRKKFNAWVKQAADLFHTPDGRSRRYSAVGKLLYRSYGCEGCHTTSNGSLGTGPTWHNMAGSPVPLNDGTTVRADYGYLRQSILLPGAKVVRGFQNVMPSYAGRLDDKQINALIWYMNRLSDHSDKASHPPVPDQPVTGPARGHRQARKLLHPRYNRLNGKPHGRKPKSKAKKQAAQNPGPPARKQAGAATMPSEQSQRMERRL